MKRCILICLIFLATLQINATTYFISPSGSNSNTGSIGNPWQTLSYACSQTLQGDIIYVTPGLHTSYITSELPVGVSIEGAGSSSHIVSYALGPTILLKSTSVINGNQHIFGIRIDGTDAVNGSAIMIDGRSNVSIYNCTFTNYKLTDNYLLDRVDFAVEIKNTFGGISIHHNIIEGGIRAFYCKKILYPFSLDIHHNMFGSSLMNKWPETGFYACDIDEVLIRNNYFKNIATQIEISSYANTSLRNIYIYSNIMYNIGVTSGDWYGSGIMFSGLTSQRANNINIVNNTIIANSDTRNTMIGIWLPTVGHASNIVIRNNIIQGFKYASIFAAGTLSSIAYPGTSQPIIDTISIENNILYENAKLMMLDSLYPSNDLPYYTNIDLPLNSVQQKNILINPMFISVIDFHLQLISLGIGGGLYTTWITEDYEDYRINNPPNIGAYGGILVPTIIKSIVISKKGDEFLIYPNPVKDYITLSIKNSEFNPTSLQIFNLMGKLVYEQKFSLILSDLGIYTFQIDIIPGTYIVVVRNAKKEMLTSKIIVVNR